MSGLLTFVEAARELRISVRTVRRLVVTGALPVTRPSPGRVAIRRGDLERYIAARTAVAAPHVEAPAAGVVVTGKDWWR